MVSECFLTLLLLQGVAERLEVGINSAADYDHFSRAGQNTKVRNIPARNWDAEKCPQKFLLQCSLLSGKRSVSCTNLFLRAKRNTRGLHLA